MTLERLIRRLEERRDQFAMYDQLVNGEKLCNSLLAELVVYRHSADAAALSLPEAAHRAGVSERTLRRWAASEKVRAVKKAGRLHFFAEDLPQRESVAQPGDTYDPSYYARRVAVRRMHGA